MYWVGKQLAQAELAVTCQKSYCDFNEKFSEQLVLGTSAL